MSRLARVYEDRVWSLYANLLRPDRFHPRLLSSFPTIPHRLCAQQRRPVRHDPLQLSGQEPDRIRRYAPHLQTTIDKTPPRTSALPCDAETVFSSYSNPSSMPSHTTPYFGSTPSGNQSVPQAPYSFDLTIAISLPSPRCAAHLSCRRYIRNIVNNPRSPSARRVAPKGWVMSRGWIRWHRCGRGVPTGEDDYAVGGVSRVRACIVVVRVRVRLTDTLRRSDLWY